jgi:hypothetical protein
MSSVFEWHKQFVEGREKEKKMKCLKESMKMLKNAESGALRQSTKFIMWKY